VSLFAYVPDMCIYLYIYNRNLTDVSSGLSKDSTQDTQTSYKLASTLCVAASSYSSSNRSGSSRWFAQ
jgi:hypothetical protein